MAVESIAQLVALLVAVLGIIWHQQHSTDKLRDEVISNGQRLARIEGFLRIGMPAPTEAGSTEVPAPESASASSESGVETPASG
ncbi:MAG: hypothetical protein OXI18_13765 [bacterium]|nr:hypothetical protein [bacterium]